MISSISITDKGFVLVAKDGTHPKHGDIVKCFRGEEHILNGGSAPHNPSSSGHVWVKTLDGYSREYYPSVFDLEWVRIEE